MTSDRKNPGVAFWATVVVVVVLVYLASFVGIVTLDTVDMVPGWFYPALKWIYAPCLWLLHVLSK